MGKSNLGVLLLCTIVCGAGCHSQSASRTTTEANITNSLNNSKFPQVYAVSNNESSFIYVKDPGSNLARRLTSRKHGWESYPVVSSNGKLIAYSLSDGPETMSEVWVSQIDGTKAHRVSAANEDALMPAFCPDGRTLLYVMSRFSGHYSPIARPRRHDFDVMKVAVDPDGPIAGITPVELTQQHFFDLRSLSVSSDGQHFLVSTSGYPIGDLIEGFEIDHPLEIKFIYQPHVPSEPSSGPAFGQAAYSRDGMNIVFSGATEHVEGGNFDYSVYQMSAVTGADVTILSRHAGMIDGLDVGPDGTIFVSADGNRYILDPQARLLNQIP